MPQIYGLYDPSEQGAPCVRYVGFTGFSIERRVIEHVADAVRGHQNHRCNWIRSLIAKDIRPAAVILETVTEENWQERERYWIERLRPQLTNTTDGGEGLVNPSQDVRDRISTKVSNGLIGNQRRKGIPHSDVDKRKISEGLKNSVARKAYTDSLKGHAPAAATEASRLINTGRPKSPEHIEKLRLASLGNKSNLGRTFSVEHKAKIGAAQIGNRRGLGYRHTDEARSKIAEKARRKWITNGAETRKLDFDEALPEGWRFGMK